MNAEEGVIEAFMFACSIMLQLHSLKISHIFHLTSHINVQFIIIYAYGNI